MGYNSETKILTKPISVSDVATVLGESNLDVGSLCTSVNINKWSKYKPISYNKWSELSENEREGTTSDIENDIHFGIRIVGVPTTALLDSNLSEIHNAEFTYLQPTGGSESPFRLTDFHKYKPDGSPNPETSFQISQKNGKLEGYYNDEDLLIGSLSGIVIKYDENNTYGVDFTEMFTSGGSESIQNALARSYPCILVTDSLGKSYFTALDYPGDLNNESKARPLYYNNNYQESTNWSVRFGKPTLRNGINLSTTKPWNSPQEEMRATLFLLKSADVDGPYLDIAKTQNFSENWISLEVGNSFPASYKPIVLPADILGAPLSLSKYGTSIAYLEPTGVTCLDNMLTIQCAKEGTFEDNTTVTHYAYIDGVRTSIKSFKASNLMIPAISYVASDFGLANFMSGTTYTVKVHITTTDSNGSTSKIGTFTFTA